MKRQPILLAMDLGGLGGGGGGKSESSSATATGGNSFGTSGGGDMNNPWIVLAIVAVFIFGLLGFAWVAKK